MHAAPCKNPRSTANCENRAAIQMKIATPANAKNHLLAQKIRNFFITFWRGFEKISRDFYHLLAQKNAQKMHLLALKNSTFLPRGLAPFGAKNVPFGAKSVPFGANNTLLQKPRGASRLGLRLFWKSGFWRIKYLI